MTQFFSEALEADGISRAALRLRHVGLGLVAAVTLAAMAFIFWDIDRQLDHNNTSDSDNVTWVIAQVEVDLLKLDRAVTDAIMAGATPEALDRLRLAYDIFYSRMLVIARSENITALPIDVNLRDSVWSAGGFFERFTPLIDGPEPALAAALPAFAAELDGMTPKVREQVVASLQGVMGEADRDRADLRRSLQVFAAAALGLLGLMLGLSTVILMQNRAQMKRAAVTARAVHNLRATIESALDAVVIADAQGRIIDCNRSAEALFQLPRHRARGARFSDMVRADGLDDPLAQLHLHLRGKDDWAGLRDGRIEMKAIRNGSVAVPVEAALAEAKGAGGEPLFIAFLRDISERLEREESLRKARNDALKGEEAKARFLAVMSHEMRTPLNGLIAAAELLQSSTRQDERQSWLSEIVLSCGWAALDQVNNVLELTRLGSASAVSYPVAVFSPEQVVTELLLQNEPHAAKRGNALLLEVDKGTIPLVRAPRQLFLRVLYNLVGNAIKFTDAGSVTVRMRAQEDEPGKVRLLVSVADTGIGIAHDDLMRIFHNFETLDDSYARMREGTGLGLGIAKLSAEALGGEIRVESRLGEGSTFTLDVILPVASAEAGDQPDDPRSAPAAAPAPADQVLSILVAEDNPINSLLLTEMLHLRGHRVTVTVDGLEAVERAAREHFDVILMDISMPRMDGLEATRRIRQGGQSAAVPIIGVTANASPDRMPDFLGAGMDDVIVKPITRGALAKVLATHGDGGQRRPVPDPAATGGMLDDAVFAETVEEMGRDFVERVAAKCLAEVEASVTAAEAALSGDPAGAARIAHKSAGAAATIGLARLHRGLAAIETAALAGDTPQARTEIADLRAALPATVAALRAQGLALDCPAD
ncbi:MAG: hypothetical protein RIR62_1407 [Pseudomonadota bacterium]